jgi:hypothetical protein
VATVVDADVVASGGGLSPGKMMCALSFFSWYLSNPPTREMSGPEGSGHDACTGRGRPGLSGAARSFTRKGALRWRFLAGTHCFAPAPPAVFLSFSVAACLDHSSLMSCASSLPGCDGGIQAACTRNLSRHSAPLGYCAMDWSNTVAMGAEAISHARKGSEVSSADS